MACDDVGRGDAELAPVLSGLHPDAQRVLAAEDLHAGDAFDAGDLVLQVDDGVVGEKILAQLAAGRVDGHQHQRRGQRLLHGEAGGGDLRRQLRLRLVDAQLRQHLVDVGIGLDIEVDEELDHAVVGADRVHVDHVVDAVHLLLDRRGDGLREGLGVGARIGRRSPESPAERYRETATVGSVSIDTSAEDHGQDGDDDGDNGPADKEFRHRLPPCRRWWPGAAGPRRRRVRADGRALAQLLQVVGDDVRAGRKTARSTSQLVPNCGPSSTLATWTLLSAPDDVDLLQALQLLHRDLRDKQGIVAHFVSRLDAAELAGAQNVAGIGEHGRDADGAGLRVHLAIDEHDVALVGIDLAVGERQREGNRGCTLEQIAAGRCERVAMRREVLGSR